MTDVETALSLAKRGWHVFPVEHRGKRPTVRWSEQASDDPQQVAFWFSGTAARNVGIACGPSGLLVIDEDTPGDFEKYAATLGAAVPDTFMVATGRGQHYYFDANGDAFGNAEHALRDYGVNVRGRGGYVVGPGSMHASGTEYRIAQDRDPVPVPTWLRDALTPDQQPSVDGEQFGARGLDSVPQIIRVGHRDTEIFRYACSLRARDTPVSEARVLLRMVWERCEQQPSDPFTWHDALSKLRDAYERYPVSDSYATIESSDQAPGGVEDALLGRVLPRSGLADLPPLNPLVHGLLDYPTAGVLVGDYGLGKTFLAVSLACSVATGRSWLGQPVERRKVLLIVGEGGSGLDRRIAAWEQGYNRNQPVGDDDLTVIVQPDSLINHNVWHRIGEQCATRNIGFVILDTLSSLAPDADETKDAAIILRHMHNLAGHINGTVLLVHHPGWGDKGRTRGGYQFEGNADSVLVLAGTPDVPEVSLTRKKHKDGQAGQVFWMRRHTYRLHDRHAGETSVVMQSINATDVAVPMIERIKVVLENCGEAGATGPQIMDDLGEVSRSTFYKAINKAINDDVIVKRGQGQRQRYFLNGKG